MWMIFCGRPPKNILEEALAALEEKFTLATPEWVTMENRWRTRSPSVGMKSQRPNRAMLWGERNSSETSSRSTTSVRQLESLAQSLKRDQKSPARTSPAQSFEPPAVARGVDVAHNKGATRCGGWG